MDKRAKNELGNRYASLEVVAPAESEGAGAMWICLCDCGEFVKMRAASLRRGYNKDCGCGISGYKKLQDALIDIGTPPCEKGCVYVERCAEEEMACQQFRSWYEWGGDIDPHPELYRPTRQCFEAIFRDKQSKQGRKRRKGSSKDTAGRDRD